VHTKGVTLAKNDHPTVKPQDLIRYFARMILPPERVDGKPRRILVPFSGSGSEMIGCLQAGWDEVVGIERESRFADIAEARIRRGDIFKIGRKK
jgi:site-specific DNA-methyltransferase (adenine-specific)